MLILLILLHFATPSSSLRVVQPTLISWTDSLNFKHSLVLYNITQKAQAIASWNSSFPAYYALSDSDQVIWSQEQAHFYVFTRMEIATAVSYVYADGTNGEGVSTNAEGAATSRKGQVSTSNQEMSNIFTISGLSDESSNYHQHCVYMRVDSSDATYEIDQKLYSCESTCGKISPMTQLFYNANRCATISPSDIIKDELYIKAYELSTLKQLSTLKVHELSIELGHKNLGVEVKMGQNIADSSLKVTKISTPKQQDIILKARRLSSKRQLQVSIQSLVPNYLFARVHCSAGDEIDFCNQDFTIDPNGEVSFNVIAQDLSKQITIEVQGEQGAIRAILKENIIESIGGSDMAVNEPNAVVIPKFVIVLIVVFSFLFVVIAGVVIFVLSRRLGRVNMKESSNLSEAVVVEAGEEKKSVGSTNDSKETRAESELSEKSEGKERRRNKKKQKQQNKICFSDDLMPPLTESEQHLARADRQAIENLGKVRI